MKKSKFFFYSTAIILFCLIAGALSEIYFCKGLPFLFKKNVWSIGLYAGADPFSLSPYQEVQNPIITRQDVTDIKADFVADPFALHDNNTWYLFFEVLNKETHQGDIGLATSDDGTTWRYQQIVLDEPFHLSYPYVFKWKNNYYMVPEGHKDKTVRLYKASRFPFEWEHITNLLSDGEYTDSSPFYYHNTWWMFSSKAGNDNLHLFYADTLTGPWTEHPRSPVIVNDETIARPGGRVLVYQDKVFRFPQDDFPCYGESVLAFEITKLTKTDYEEKQVATGPIVSAGTKTWNKNGMHQVDHHRLGDGTWLVFVDGNYRGRWLLNNTIKTRLSNLFPGIKRQCSVK